MTELRHLERRPNFFIVGAPRCGTTSLTAWLGQHPDVFLPEIKVPFHFAADLDMVPKRQFRDLDAYLDLFAAAGTQPRRGESTPFYLFSERAAQEIRDFEPEARIIIMLRNPVDMMYSMHARNLMDGNEEIRDFAEALEAETARKDGHRLPRGCFFRQGLYYRALARFPAQVKRYLDCFERAQVHIVVFDDLKRDPQATLNRGLSFLGLETRVEVMLERANPSVGVRSPALAGILREPPAALQRLPGGLGDGLVWRLNRWNTSAPPPPPMDPALRRRLLEEFAPDVRELGELLGRDLTHWLA